MKVIVAGSRNVKNYGLVENIIDTVCSQYGVVITELVSGGARGPDTLGETYAVKYDIPIKRFPADWKKYGLSAGPIRNAQMGDYGDVLIAIWDGESRGTKHMIDYAIRKKKKVFVYNIKEASLSCY
jgi:hypothetical protein